MRMNMESAQTAADILNHYSETRLLSIFSEYGEVRNAKQLARKIVEARANGTKIYHYARLYCFFRKYNNRQT